MRPVCKHCGVKPVNRPRGLCWTCFHAPGIRELYPSTSIYARRGVGNFTGNAPLAPEPTAAAPGTPEKMAVLAERARLGQALHHPLDPQLGAPQPWAVPVVTFTPPRRQRKVDGTN